MPREFIPQSDYPLYMPKQFELIITLLDFWETFELPESWIAESLDPWFMPNSPIRGEN